MTHQQATRILSERRGDPQPASGEEHAREELERRSLSSRRDKWCCSCQQWLPIEAFTANPNNRNRIDSWCRPFHAEAAREWRVKNRNYVEAYNAKRRVEYRGDHPLATRPCAVCKRPMTRPANVLVCSSECRRQRKREQRQRAQRAA
jgi:hypothetical protein